MKLISTLAVVMTVGLRVTHVLADSPPESPVTGGTELVDVDFERHVTGLFGRLGCNSAACHGSFQGKGGFRLSLFGQSAAMDHAAILGEADSGRIDLDSPDDSLLLAKPSGREPHGGGVRLPEGSWEYRLIRQWISAGALRTPESGSVAKLMLDPVEVPPLEIGQKISLRVMAEFMDGQRKDVTPFAEFRSRDDAVVDASATGSLVARAAGDSSVVVSYRGTFLGVPVIVPYPSTGPLPKTTAASNWIDEEVNFRLAQLGLAASPLTGDAEFLRRVSLDVIGIIPTSEETRSFLSDGDPNKRSKKIDVLLSHPRRAACWATKMCDVTACDIDHLAGTEELRPKRAKMWHDWFRRRFAENMSYDQIVEGVLCATSRQNRSVEEWIDEEVALDQTARAGFDTSYKDRPSLDLFWQRMGPQGPLPVEELAELTATAFLGIRLHCARCHRHPYDHWTQDDFAGYANIFAHTEFGSSTELRVAVNDRLERRRQAKRDGQTPPEFPRLQEVFLNPTPRPLIDALTTNPVPPKSPGGPILTDEGDLREALFRWLKRADNPYFAANFVNRVWARYFGAGLVEPVDAFSTANPATHPRLLRRLSDEFVTSGYDIRCLERLILSSQAYQRTSRPEGNNASDLHNFAHASVRPLLAEVLIDSLNASLESTDKFGSDVPDGSQAIELAPNRFSDPYVNELFRILGRGNRKSLCECGRAPSPSIRQPLFLMSDVKVIDKIRRGRLSRLLQQNAADTEIVDEFYLATLSRHPDADELDFSRQHISAGSSRVEGLCDLVWALINSREFSTNH